MTKFFSDYKYFLLTSFVVIILLHNFKNFSIYNITIAAILLLCIITIFLSKKGLVSFNNSTGFYYLFFLLYLPVILVVSAIYVTRFGLDNQTFFIASIRLFIMPLFVFIILNLIKNIEDFNYIISIYVFFMVLAGLSLYLQHFYGSIDIFGQGYDWERYRVPGYASTTGNVVTYGPSITLAVLYLAFVSKVGILKKLLYLSIILSAVFFTGSKSALINLVIVVLILLFFLKYFKRKYILFLGVGIFLIYLFFNDQNFQIAAINISSQIIGVELGENSIRYALYQPIDEMIYNRVLSKWFIYAIENNHITEMDYLFGKGLVGGSGALSAMLPYGENHPFYELSPNTFHSSFLDLFQMGGFVIAIPYVMLIINIQFCLYYYYKNNDRLAFVFLLSNFVYFINCFVANGVMFQPYTSFGFWLSIAYLIKRKSIISINK